ncbi:aldehyde dehydrogenase family protein [Nonomuraea sediminis]|uniref:aldehyde dehydrogenase family protein n=1 Tax=Nonomuraea sediminis TaxID=2835864 RepID=UPI002029F042|nr:aldehyde dehydrogenase family protein [Nonomuraea sediminis]
MPCCDPNDPETWIGPLATSQQRDHVESYIKLGLEEGAKLAYGGGRGDQPTGWYVEPTVFVGMDDSMRIAREEIFGPVIGVIPFDDEEEAIRIANDSELNAPFGGFKASGLGREGLEAYVEHKSIARLG